MNMDFFFSLLCSQGDFSDPTSGHASYHEAAQACFCFLSRQPAVNSSLCLESIFIAPLLCTELQNTTNASNRVNILE